MTDQTTDEQGQLRSLCERLDTMITDLRTWLGEESGTPEHRATIEALLDECTAMRGTVERRLAQARS